jgi:hypothetical protein
MWGIYVRRTGLKKRWSLLGVAGENLREATREAHRVPE